METLFVGLMRLPLVGKLMISLFGILFRFFARVMRRVDRHTVRPREWSNRELAKVAGVFDGAVINVSGWRDEDQRGGHYRDYFPRAASYVVSNFRGTRGMEADDPNAVFIDLEGELQDELKGRYQVAFNHTTLEHIFEIRKAIANICALSSDTVILVTPFLQAVHFEPGAFGDYWRPTPMCLNRMLEDNGFTTVYQTCNDTPWHYVYVFTVACRNPKRPIGIDVPLNVPVVGSGHFSVN